MRTAAAWSGGGRIEGGVPERGAGLLKVDIIFVIGSHEGWRRIGAKPKKRPGPRLKGAEPMGRKLMLASWEEHSLPVTASVIAATASGIAARCAAAASAVAPRSGRALTRRTVTRGALPGRVIAGALADHRRRDSQRFLPARTARILVAPRLRLLPVGVRARLIILPRRRSVLPGRRSVRVAGRRGSESLPAAPIAIGPRRRLLIHLRRSRWPIVRLHLSKSVAGHTLLISLPLLIPLRTCGLVGRRSKPPPSIVLSTRSGLSAADVVWLGERAALHAVGCCCRKN